MSVSTAPPPEPHCSGDFPVYGKTRADTARMVLIAQAVVQRAACCHQWDSDVGHDLSTLSPMFFVDPSILFRISAELRTAERAE